MDVAAETPVLVGVASVMQRCEEAGSGREPSELMIEALQRAAVDAGSEEFLLRADRIEVPRGIWSYSNPAALVAQGIGASHASTVLAEIGILQQSLVNRACSSIASGAASIVLVTGAEAKYRNLRGQIAGVDVAETAQTESQPDVVLQPEAELWSPVESDTGLGMPVGYYAIMDSALRAAQGLTIAEHRAQMGAIYQGYSEIAADNPDAWVREPASAEFISEHSAKNRMLAFPYTKLHNSQWNVDQGAGLIFCAARVAAELAVPRDQWIFPLACAESNAMSVVSSRRDLHRSVGFRETGQRVLELADKTPQDIDLMELYSCFPQAVRVQLEEIGIPVDRPLSVTGAMTFAGGPLNNFLLQATVKMVQLLRQSPGQTGLVTCVSGMNTKQACALYSTAANPRGWRYADVSAQVRAATQLCELVSGVEGEAHIVGYTVLYQGDNPWRAVAVCDMADGQRTVAYSEAPDLMADMQSREFCGQRVTISEGQFCQ
jgi:acetyl-CoA C-acetyltransferase